MPGQGSRHSEKLPAVGFALVLLSLVDGAGAGAQEAGRNAGAVALRPTTDATASPPDETLTPRPPSPTAAPIQPVPTPARSPAFATAVHRVVTGLPPPTPWAPPPRRRTGDDSYNQVGYRTAGVLLLPAIEQHVGFDDNPKRAAGSKGSAVHRTEAELKLKSEWPRHELTGTLRGAYNVYAGIDNAEGVGRLNLRLDVSRDTLVDFETRYLVDTQRPGSIELNVPVRERPLVLTGGASAGISQRFNRLVLGLRGTVDRIFYEDARLPSGAILDQSDRDQTEYGLRLRAGYEVMPGLIPFVEAVADTRVFDRRFDNAGLARSSDGVAARVGTTFEVTRTLAGEVSASYEGRTYDDPRLRDVHGPLVDAALAWSATPLTTVRLRAAGRIEDTTVPGASAALAQRVGVEVQHDLRRNVSLIGALTLSEAGYRGVSLREQGFIGSLKVDYRLSRALSLRGSYTYERLWGTLPGSGYAANVYLLGLRFQP